MEKIFDNKVAIITGASFVLAGQMQLHLPTEDENSNCRLDRR